MKKRVLGLVGGVFPYLFVFLSSIFQPFDPDLGWHLKYGEYFFQHFSILRDNTFSSDMPFYHWVNFSWGTDVLTYFFYHIGGFFGLSLAGAGVVTLTFFFFAKASKLDYFEKALIFPLVLFLEEMVISVSFRGQLISICFMGVLWYLVSSYEGGKSRSLYLTPLLFFLWANLHGQFFVGLGIFSLWMGGFLVKRFFEEKKQFKKLIPQMRFFAVIAFLCFVATLVNPFGVGIYQETFKYIHNPLLQDVTEYLAPGDLSRTWWNHILVGLLVGVGIVLRFFKDNVKDIISLSGIFGILYGLSFIIRRYSWTMYYFAIPFLKPVAAFLKPDSKKASFTAATALVAISTCVVLFVKAPWSQYTTMSWDTYCKKYQECSPDAADFLATISSRGNIMNLYAWGGWLIWNYPQIKPSIDGRMHLWKDKGVSAFEIYYDYEQNYKDVDDSTYDTVFMSKTKPVYERLISLTKQGRWKLVYQDSTSAIFVRNTR